MIPAPSTPLPILQLIATAVLQQNLSKVGTETSRKIYLQRILSAVAILAGGLDR